MALGWSDQSTGASHCGLRSCCSLHQALDVAGAAICWLARGGFRPLGLNSERNGSMAPGAGCKPLAACALALSLAIGRGCAAGRGGACPGSLHLFAQFPRN